MRTLLLNLMMMGALFGIWYGYAPLDHKMRVPTEVRQTVSALDNLASSGVYHLTALVDGKAPPAPVISDKDTGPLIMGGDEGIDVHREDGTGKVATPGTPDPDMFAGLSLRNATLAETRLDGYNLDFTDMRGVALANVTLQKASGQDARFDDALILRADFSRGVFRRERFDRAVIAHSVFEGAEIIEGSFIDVVMRGGSFSGATLAGSRFDQARFERTDLRQVDFGVSSFVNATFDGARLNGSSLAAANLSGADLTTAVGLTQSQLDKACGSETTLLPEGLSVPPCAPSLRQLAQIR